jgi:hypothetical protein
MTTLWRRNHNGEPVCNACGLYYKLHNVSLLRNHFVISLLFLFFSFFLFQILYVLVFIEETHNRNSIDSRQQYVITRYRVIVNAH